MKIERIWKSIFKMSNPLDSMAPFRKINEWVLDSEGTPKRWEFGADAFLELRILRAEGTKVCICRTSEDLPIPDRLWGSPIKENKNLSRYAVVLHYKKRRKVQWKKETKTFVVDSWDENHEYNVAGYNVDEGFLYLYDKDCAVAAYRPGSWISVWEKDRRVVAAE